jgi:hypothetical protein
MATTAKSDKPNKYLLLFKDFEESCTKSNDNTVTYNNKIATPTTPKSIVYEIILNPEHKIGVVKDITITKNDTNYDFKVDGEQRNVKIWHGKKYPKQMNIKNCNCNKKKKECKCDPKYTIDAYFNYRIQPTDKINLNTLKTVELYIVLKYEIKKIEKVYYFDKLNDDLKKLLRLENISSTESSTDSSSNNLPMLYVVNTSGNGIEEIRDKISGYTDTSIPAAPVVASSSRELENCIKEFSLDIDAGVLKICGIELKLGNCYVINNKNLFVTKIDFINIENEKKDIEPEKATLVKTKGVKQIAIKLIKYIDKSINENKFRIQIEIFNFITVKFETAIVINLLDLLFIRGIKSKIIALNYCYPEPLLSDDNKTCSFVINGQNYLYEVGKCYDLTNYIIKILGFSKDTDIINYESRWYHKNNKTWERTTNNITFMIHTWDLKLLNMIREIDCPPGDVDPQASTLTSESQDKLNKEYIGKCIKYYDKIYHVKSIKSIIVEYANMYIIKANEIRNKMKMDEEEIKIFKEAITNVKTKECKFIPYKFITEENILILNPEKEKLKLEFKKGTSVTLNGIPLLINIITRDEDDSSKFKLTFDNDTQKSLTLEEIKYSFIPSSTDSITTTKTQLVASPVVEPAAEDESVAVERPAVEDTQVDKIVYVSVGDDMTATYKGKKYKKGDCFTLTSELEPRKIYKITEIIKDETHQHLKFNYIKKQIRSKFRDTVHNMEIPLDNIENTITIIENCESPIKGIGRMLQIVFVASNQFINDVATKLKHYQIKTHSENFNPLQKNSNLFLETQVVYAKQNTKDQNASRISLTNGKLTPNNKVRALGNFTLEEIINIEKNIFKIYDTSAGAKGHTIMYFGNEENLPTEVTKYNSLDTISIVSKIYNIKESNNNVLLIFDLDFITNLGDDIVKDFFTQLRYRDYIKTGKIEYKFEAPPEATQEDTKRAISEADESSLGGGAIKDNKIKMYKFKKLKLRYKLKK